MSEENNMKNEVNSIGNSAKIDLAKTDEYNPYMGNPQENEDIQKIATSVLKIKNDYGGLKNNNAKRAETAIF